MGHIRIRARREKEDFLVIVEDDGIGISSEVLERIREGLNSRELNRPHIGVSNVHQRLRLKYGNGYGLVVESEEGCFTRVAVRIPTGGNRPAMS